MNQPLRASDLARRVTLVAAVMDELAMTGSIEVQHWDGRVTVTATTADQRLELATRLGLDHLRLFTAHYGSPPMAWSEGTWADIPIRVTSLASRDEVTEQLAGAA